MIGGRSPEAVPVTTVGGEVVRLQLRPDGSIRISVDPHWLPALTLSSEMAYRLGTQLRELTTR